MQCFKHSLLTIDHSHSLLGNLEFAHFGELAGLVDEAVNVDTTGKIAKVDGGVVGDVDLFDHLAAQYVIDLDGVTFIEAFLKIEGNDRSGRVGIEPENGGRNT